MKLHLNGVARRVVIDDRLPVDRAGRLLCSRARESGVLWVSLIEKAYLKVGQRAPRRARSREHPGSLSPGTALGGFPSTPTPRHARLGTHASAPTPRARSPVRPSPF